ncbi:hypothetical protein BpHYR1_048553 [Brachionus plicatilis]|uniref:Uncharacterized protein n=1 Tax=Brachionus plicatilis TaxID=10195 RepID=A0A3M7SJL7_BRAPC|nr:hypothetical protein BpHYR1_048553 [Brachionus plicatilis]
MLEFSQSLEFFFTNLYNIYCYDKLFLLNFTNRKNVINISFTFKWPHFIKILVISELKDCIIKIVIEKNGDWSDH